MRFDNRHFVNVLRRKLPDGRFNPASLLPMQFQLSDRARRIQNGYARECPNCNVLIFFESESHDEHIKHALKAAHKLRRALAQAEEVKLSPNEAPEYNRTS
jgi:hypothetical protein